ncbi:MAG: EF-P lysine aminoacylase EpmA [Thermodesulfobacteriota bacterium]|nr:EF-P lysine aminoacylase EpmA [Thermodesulfobacteriota bacterium]
MPFYRQAVINKNLNIRARTVQAVRAFFIEKGYLEIETPCRIPAPAPEEHIDAEISRDWYLQTSPELCMKRLLASGYSRIFQICKCFRQNERGSKHLPELTMLEWYASGTDYFDMMAQTEDLICHVAENMNSNRQLVYQGGKIDLQKPWPKISVTEAFDKFTGTTLKNVISEDLFDELLTAEIEPNLGQERPVFLYDYPASFAPLARVKPDNPFLAQRFELYIAGLELCNAFTELNDAAEQRKRFEVELKKRHHLGKGVYPMPEKFLEFLKVMPAASGNALGIDRLVMLFADTAKIDDVVAFTPEEL